MSPYQALRLASFAFVSALGLAGVIALSSMIAVPGWAETCPLPRPAPNYSMEVLVDGTPLAVYSAKGATYVEALKGREYAIRLSNRTGERVAVALAVDGLNSIDAKHTSPREARKWILAPWETVTLSGWQTSSGTARRFVFTSESKSYGAWLGRTSDLGVISAAFFREARRLDDLAPTSPAPQSMFKQNEESGRGDGPSSDRALGGLGEMKAAPKDELAATGIGREVEHRVVQVDFDEEDAAAATLNVRYEYHEALVRLGVIPAGDPALARRERARGFAEQDFAPDPFRGR